MALLMFWVALSQCATLIGAKSGRHLGMRYVGRGSTNKKPSELLGQKMASRDGVEPSLMA